MVRMSVVYEGDLRCRLTHGPSGAQILTDAPADNQGKGGAFSPTDLVCAALASCMATTMGIGARARGIALEGLRVEVSKEMSAQPPRRIARIAVTVLFPSGMSEEHRATMRRVGEACPVHRSLHPDVVVDVEYR